MTFKIITADERLREQTGVKMIIIGPYGIGKTSLLKTLDEPTLCLDFEAGLLAVQDWKGSTLTVRTWPEARDLACLIGGPNPALRSEQAYSARHFETLQTENSLDLSTFQIFFVDSLTVAARLCFQWCKQQPEAFAEKTGKPDTRAAYALLASEMMGWLNQFQHIPNKDVIFVGLLEPRTDEFQKQTWHLQCEGSKTALELPGILDEVISMVPGPMKAGLHGNPVPDSQGNRVFVCQTLNPFGYPAKDRSGRLDVSEPAHLGNLLKKIRRTA